ncbi:OmpA family protein [Variovorax sp. KK3]|uniref:OmpA family protein n=1 Tax=Variovorax sp. KK3 TaxID=1855728 RepID=UPI00097CBDE9|nr:OmpA family protein [Variovorax sp. KK3]
MLKLLLALLMLIGGANALAMTKATWPTADLKGAKDSALLKRYEGAYIVVTEQKAFAEFVLPVSALVEVPDKRDRMNNRLHEPKERKALEGAYTRLVYVVPNGRSPLEVSRNYRDEIQGKGGQVLFECKDADCGGDPKRGSSGGGGEMSMAMYLYPESRVTAEYGSTGYCAMTAYISDQRYLAAQMPNAGAHVSVLTYTVVAPDRNGICNGINERTVAVVDIVEAKAREQKMVTVQASEMASAIAGTGRIALYGIFFDFNKADVKPESDATLEQISKLLKDNKALKLIVVGHTDNVGGFSSNMDLSQRRAAAVVASLVQRGIGKERLAPHGVSFASPVATNKTDEGRAKNRRVELVEN